MKQMSVRNQSMFLEQNIPNLIKVNIVERIYRNIYVSPKYAWWLDQKASDSHPSEWCLCLLSAGTSSCKTLRHGGWQAEVYSAGAQDAIYIWSSKYFVCVLYFKWKAVIAGTCELSISCLCYVIISTNI